MCPSLEKKHHKKPISPILIVKIYCRHLRNRSCHIPRQDFGNTTLIIFNLHSFPFSFQHFSTQLRDSQLVWSPRIKNQHKTEFFKYSPLLNPQFGLHSWYLPANISTKTSKNSPRCSGGWIFEKKALNKMIKKLTIMERENKPLYLVHEF